MGQTALPSETLSSVILLLDAFSPVMVWLFGVLTKPHTLGWVPVTMGPCISLFHDTFTKVIGFVSVPTIGKCKAPMLYLLGSVALS